MPGNGAPPRPGLAQGSGGLAGAGAWTGSGSRVTDGWWDTTLETAWASLAEEECERKVWLHEKRWWTKRRKRRVEFWTMTIHEESLLW